MMMPAVACCWRYEVRAEAKHKRLKSETQHF